MATSERVPVRERSLIPQKIITELAEEALRKGVGFGDAVVTDSILGRIRAELLRREDRFSDAIGFTRHARQRVRQTVRERGRITIPVYNPNSRWMLGDISAPVTARIFEDLHAGFIQAVRSPSKKLRLEADVLYYTPQLYTEGDMYVIAPHIDEEYKYFQAILTVYGNADFFYSPHGLKPLATHGFHTSPQVRKVSPGTLTVLRGTSFKRYGPAPAHAVSPPTNRSGIRMALGFGYL